jgi:hypothetical protein
LGLLRGVRRVIQPALLGLLLAACAAPAPTPAPTANIDATGILLIEVGDEVQTGPLTRRFANAFSDAMAMAEANGDDLGYPWVDQATGELVLSVVTPRGRELVEEASVTVPHRIRDVAHGAAELQRIQDEVIALGQRGVTDSHLISATLPDLRDNRALIVISAMSVPLLEYLAETYPVDAIAVQVDPDRGSLTGP